MSQFDFQNIYGQKLTGRLETADGSPRAFAIFAHCFTCSKNVKAASQISKQLAALGIAVLRFDFTGLGNSDGDFANTNFSSNVADLLSAAEALSREFQPPSMLIGHSLGGAASLMAASQIDSIEAVATIGAPSEPAHVSHLFGDKVAEIESDGSALISIGGRDLRIEKQFLDDIRSHSVLNSVQSLRRPLMIFHSPVDSIVSIENARQIYESAKHPKSFISLDNADHMLSKPQDATFVAETLSAWSGRFLSNSEDITSVTALDDGVVVVREVGSGLSQQIQAGSHSFAADEPSSVGGADTGPNPYDFLLASLGTCTSMTLRMYAKRKGWHLDTISIRLSHSRIHADDCSNCESTDGRIDRIKKTIEVTGNLDSIQIERLGEIADRCPVHRTLLNEKQIDSSIHLRQT